MAQIWVGTEDALMDALAAELTTPEAVAGVELARHCHFDPAVIARWCGIEPPPATADDHVIYDAPIEAGGTPTWREYRHRSIKVFAPECDLVFARVSALSA